MTMVLSVADRLTVWARAARDAEANPKFLLNGGGSTVAAKRMRALARAEHLLEELDGRLWLSRQLERYLDARKDRECMICATRGGGPMQHPDCERKQREYFAAREELLASIPF